MPNQDILHVPYRIMEKLKIEGLEIIKSDGGVSQFVLKNTTNEIHQYDDKMEHEQHVRVYCTQQQGLKKSHFKIQIRSKSTLKPEWSTTAKQIKRQFIATTTLTIEQVEAILIYMKNEVRR